MSAPDGQSFPPQHGPVPPGQLPPHYVQHPQQFAQYPVQYPQGPYAVMPVARGTNGLAIASMVLGILWIYWIGSVLALVFGYVARKQIRENNQSGDGMALAGIVLGWVGVGIVLLFMFFGMVGVLL